MAASLTACVRGEKRPKLSAIDLHVRMLPVGVRLVRPWLVELLVVRAGEALVVPDHVADLDVVAADEPRRELERRAHLLLVVEDLGVGRADVLDADGDVVEPDGVPAHHVRAHELVDRAAVTDYEMRARAG